MNRLPALLRMASPVLALALLASWAPSASGAPGAGSRGACGGRWSVLSSPTVPGWDSRLSAVSVVSAADAWAVGSATKEGAERTLAEHWDGRRWRIVPTPDLDPDTSELSGVAALFPDDAWAVGARVGTAGRRALIEHWDGTAWTVQPTPVVVGAAFGTVLSAVSADAADDAWAVGFFANAADIPETLIEHWDGSSWSVVPSPTAQEGGGFNHLDGVVAISPSDAWAVGDANQQPLLEHWDGILWSVASVPLDARQGLLSAVSAAPHAPPWAVGFQLVGPTWRPLLVKAKGPMPVPGPGLGSGSHFTRGVAVISRTDAWAGGTDLLHWNGVRWKSVANPRPRGSLWALAAGSTRDVWAVGSITPATGPVRTLIERFC